MTSLLRRFRGLGIALAVLAISAGAVFAAAPSMTPVSSHAADQARNHTVTADPTETPEPSESPSASPSESPSASPLQAPASPSPDTHGALVSAAAQMPTPSGFPNHGSFVSCVAHMPAPSPTASFDWSTVTPASCGLAPASTVQPGATAGTGTTHGRSGSHSHGHGNPNSGS